MNDTREIKALLFITGFVSSSVQFLMLREIVCLCGGSEFTTGLYLSLWLVLSSFGTWFKGSGKTQNIRSVLLLLISAPLVTLVLFIIFSAALLVAGEMPSLMQTLLLILVPLAPTAVISSIAFIRLSNILKMNGSAEPGHSFGLETAGSVAAGIASALTVIILLNSFLFFFITMIAAILVVTLIIFRPRLPGAIILTTASLIFTVLTIMMKPDTIIREFQLKNFRTDKTFDTPYGNVTTGYFYGEKVTFYDFRPLYYSNDNLHCEEDIHFAMLQPVKTDTVLLISGGLINHLPEIMKYNPGRIVYIEHDPGLLKTEDFSGVKEYGTVIDISGKDAFSFLKQEKQKFNIIIQLVPQPTTLDINRYYTREYFAKVKMNLTKDGMFACSPLPAYNYASDSYRKTLSSVVNALKCSFRHVTLIPGNSLYILASDIPAGTDICRLSEVKGIKNLYVNCDYLNDAELARRSSGLDSVLSPQVKVNTVARPVASWFGNTFQLEKQGVNKAAAFLIILLLALLFVRLSGKTLLIFSSSCAMSGLGVSVIFIFQVMYGNAHMLSALIISLLFAGLATGASLKAGEEGKRWLPPLLLSLILIITGLLTLTGAFAGADAGFGIVFMILTFIAGVFTGSVYRILTSGSMAVSTEKVYGADLTGSASGYLITGSVLIPLLGVMNAVFILAGIILISLFIVSVAPKL